MHGSDEYGTKHYPQERWQPSPKHSDRRTHNRPRPGNAREVMPKNRLLARGHEVDIIPQLPAGYIRRSVEAKNLAREPSAVRVVRDEESKKRAGGDQDGQHGGAEGAR